MGNLLGLPTVAVSFYSLEAMESRPPEGAQMGQCFPPFVMPFVGRHKELEMMRGLLLRVGEGQGGLVLVGGEAGVGKTRLADEVSKLARATGLDVFWGRCWEGEGTPSFWPWIQLIRHIAACRGSESVRATMGVDAPEIVKLVPELGEESDRFATGLTLCAADQARFRQFDGIASFFRRAGASRPVVLVLDDLHCADQASLLLLKFITQEIAESALLLIANYRIAESDRRGDFATVLADLVRNPASHTLLLRGLAVPDLSSLILRALGTTPSLELLDELYHQTDGNPFFACELVRLLADLGPLLSQWERKSCKLVIPESVRGLVRTRFMQLPPDTQELLTIASVVGREFSLRAVSHILGMSYSDALRSVDEVVRAGLVQRDGGNFEHYRFVHSLVRETIYDEIPSLRRANLHRAAAESIESDVKERHSSCAALSYHYGRALLVVDPDKVVRVSVIAGERAVSMFAYEDAVEHFEQAMTAVGYASGSREVYCRILLGLAEAYHKCGRVEEARARFREAGDVAKKLGDADLCARSALGFGGLFAAAGASDPELVARLENAIVEYGERASGDHSMLLARLSIALYFAGDRQRCEDMSGRALLMARRVRDGAAESFALDARHYAFHHPAGLAQRIAFARELGELGRKMQNIEMALRSHLRLCDGFLELGDIAAADAELRVADGLSVNLRQPVYRWQVLLRQATRALMEGRYSDAEVLATEGVKIGVRSGDERAVTSFLGQKLLSHRDKGGLRELAGEAAFVEVKYAQLPVWTAVNLYIRAENGELSVECMQRLGEDILSVARSVPQDAFMLGTLGLLAEVCSTTNTRDAAAVLYDLLVPFEGQNATLGLSAVFLGSVSHYLGMLSMVLGRLAESEMHLVSALSAHDRLGARPLTARTRYEYGRVLGVLGRRGAARRELARALAEFEALGMTVCALRGREALAEISPDELAGSAAASAPACLQTDWIGQGLFRSEGDYWTMSFGGRTARIKAVRGFEYIAYLLARAHQPVHALDLAVLGVRAVEGSIRVAGAVQEALQVADLGARGAILDERARIEYRGRLRELAAERDEVERLNDYGRLERIDREIETIGSYLEAGSVAGRRPRRWAAPAERARVNVRNSIAKALRLIKRHHEPLYRHLQNSLKTGAVCSYVPEQEVSWRIIGA